MRRVPRTWGLPIAVSPRKLPCAGQCERHVRLSCTDPDFADDHIGYDNPIGPLNDQIERPFAEAADIEARLPFPIVACRRFHLVRQGTPSNFSPDDALPQICVCSDL